MPPTSSTWIPFGAAGLLLIATLAGGSVVAAPAHAAPASPTPCVVAGGIASDDSFTLAVSQVNAGTCNVIEITRGFTFDGPMPEITVARDGMLSIIGPTNPTDDSILDGNGGQGLAVWISGSTLNLTVSRLTFANFDDTIGPWQSALAVAAGTVTAGFSDVAFIGNNGGVMAGGLNLDASGTTSITMTGRITFTDNTSESFSSGAVWADTSNSTLTIGAPGGDDTITFARNTSHGAAGGSIAGDTITTYSGTFSDDSAALSGGSISATGDISLTNTTFTNNTASGDEGGAVHAQGLVTINGSAFHGNRVTSANGAGGAVSANGDLTTSQVTDSTFTDNIARGHGGALRTLGRLTVAGSTFRDDSAGNSGGAIAADDTVTVTNSLFHDDTAAGSGGAIISIHASVFSQQSTYSGGTAGVNGGAISAGNGQVTSTDDTFVGNRTLRTDGDGGAVEARRATTTSSTFMGNRTARNGGAVSAATIDDSGSTFTGNRAADRGGAVNVSLASSLRNSIFSDDSAAQGGAIYSFGPLTVTDSLFEDDTATTLGGAIVAYDTLTVESSTFRHNVALQTGGAIFVDDTATIVSSVFESNEAQGPTHNSGGTGGAISAQGSVTVTGSTFDSNRAAQEGGALNAPWAVVLIDDTFTNNSSTNREGGAVNVGAGAVTITSSAFSGNSSVKDGGAVSVAGPATITSSVFTSNRSTEDTGVNGGAVSASGDVALFESEFTANSSTQWGGAVHTGGSAAVADSTFHANTTRSLGGALHIDDTGLILRSTFTDDTSGSYGGAVTATDLLMQSSSLEGNESGFGGAVYVWHSADVINSTFVDNYGGWGGAIGFAASPVPSRIAYSTLLNNRAFGATSQGSAINATITTPIALIGSVLAGAGSLCTDDVGPTNLNLTADSASSFATDTSCGGAAGSTSIDTTYTTDDSLGLTALLTTDDTPGSQVVIPDDTSVLNSVVPVSILPSVTTDQLGAPRNSPDGLTSAGAVQVRPMSVAGPANVTVAPGGTAVFSVIAYAGIGPAVSYRWQTSRDASAWTDVPSASGPTLTLPSVGTADSGLLVRVLVADAYGNDDTSSTATLTVASSPPSTLPSAPRDPEATAGDAQARVTWQAPSSPGSFPVTTYEVRSDEGSGSCVTTALECTITGLVNGRTYRFSVRALNGAGWGLWSTWSPAVTPQAPRPPRTTISITGARQGRVIVVRGTTEGLANARVRAMVRYPGQPGFESAGVRTVDGDGRFRWRMRTDLRVVVYFRHVETRSNRVVIPRYRAG